MLDLNDFQVPTNISATIKTRQQELANSEPPSEINPPNLGGGPGFYSHLFNGNVEIYDPLPNKRDYVVILPSVFPFSTKQAEFLRKEGAQVADLTEDQIATLLDTEAYHGSAGTTNSGLQFIQSPAMIVHIFGSHASRRDPRYPNFGLTAPVVCRSTAEMYPHLWPETDKSLYPFQRYLSYLKDKKYQGDFWDLVRTEDNVSAERALCKEECRAALPSMYVIMWVFPLRRIEEDRPPIPELFWVKLPAGKGFNNPNAKIKAYIGALNRARRSGSFEFLSDLSNPTVFGWTKRVQDDPRYGTFYTEGELYHLNDNSEIKRHLGSIGMTKAALDGVLKEHILPYIAANPLHSLIRFKTVDEEMEALNEVVKVVGKRVTADKGAGLLRFSDISGPGAEHPASSQNTTEKKTILGRLASSEEAVPEAHAPQSFLSEKTIKSLSAGLLLTQIANSPLAGSGDSENLLTHLLTKVAEVDPDVDIPAITDILGSNPSLLDSLYPDVASVAKELLLDMAREMGGSIPL